MTSPVLRSADEAFCRLPLLWGPSEVLIFRLGILGSGETTEIKHHSYCVLSRDQSDFSLSVAIRWFWLPGGSTELPKGWAGPWFPGMCARGCRERGLGSRSSYGNVGEPQPGRDHESASQEATVTSTAEGRRLLPRREPVPAT